MEYDNLLSANIGLMFGQIYHNLKQHRNFYACSIPLFAVQYSGQQIYSTVMVLTRCYQNRVSRADVAEMKLSEVAPSRNPNRIPRKCKHTWCFSLDITVQTNGWLNIPNLFDRADDQHCRESSCYRMKEIIRQ